MSNSHDNLDEQNAAENILEFYVNGRKIREKNASPETTLLQYLRETLNLTGTKTACDQGGCGACTVMLSRYDLVNKKVLHFTVTSCLIPICYVHGMAVTTVEGVGSTRNGLHPIQKSMVESYGLQCGFCTPGMIMTMYCLFRNNPKPSQEDMERALEGNLCRCTGYRPIIDAFRTCPMGDACCQLKSKNDISVENKVITDATRDDAHVDPTQDVIFPPELKLNTNLHREMVKFESNGWKWFRPITLQEVLQLLSKYPDATLVLGGTSVVPSIKDRKLISRTIICCTHVNEMNKFERTVDGAGYHVGAAVTFGRLEKELRNALQSGTKSNIYETILSSIRWIAADQIRNTATIGGHVMVADSYSDLNPVLMASGAYVTLASRGSSREIKIDSSFFIDKNRTIVKSDEVLVSVYIPCNGPDYMQFYKNPSRRGYDYGITNACMTLSVGDEDKVKEMNLFFGGIGQTTLQAKSVGNIAASRDWNDELLTAVLDSLVQELSQGIENGRNSNKYKLTLALGYFFKFYNYVRRSLNKEDRELDSSTIDKLSTDPCHSVQVFEHVPKDQPPHDAVGRPIPHVSSNNLVTGEARFVDDIPQYSNELFVGLVASSKSHARIIEVDTSKALEIPGVVGCIDYKDVPGSNKYGAIIKDEELFRENMVVSTSDLICGIVAENRQIARQAAKLVTVRYEELKPILTLEEAIESSSFFPSMIPPFNKGDVEVGFKSSDHVIEGEARTDRQEHFYLEPQSSLVVPLIEQGEVEVFTSAQGPNGAQDMMAHFLNVPKNRVLVRIKRAGGAFGGKEFGNLKAMGPAAIAAYKFGRPARCILDRELDIHITGKRHPFLGKYKVGFKNDGKIESMNINLYADAGHSLEISPFILQVCMSMVDGGYHFPNLHVEGHLCKTNTVSNTPMRGFGVPQATFIIENILDHMSKVLNKPSDELKSLNLYKDGDVTHYKNILTDCNLRKCWDECKMQSNFDQRLSSVQDYNKINRWKKRGLEIMPIKFAIGNPDQPLSQAGAFVNIFLDGSVLLAHGGVEMGQGINTKMIQVASRALGVPINDIFTSETACNTVPNATPTSGSSTADNNGMAVLNACTILKERLQPFRDGNPSGTFTDWVKAAYHARVSLSTTGFAKVGVNPKSGEGDRHNYLSYGVGCTEVEIDCLTGEHQVLRADLVMDVGKSLNPAIDIGQIEGAFIQGYGMMTMEKIKFAPDGQMISNGPLEYKIPGVRNIPRDFRVTLLKDCPNEKAVYSSKGIGEPPLLLGVSVFLATKNAVYAAREDQGVKGYFRMDAPATPDIIRMACQDDIIKKVTAFQ